MLGLSQKQKQPQKMHIKKDDRVVIVRGKEGPHFDDGKKVYTRGRVIKVYPSQGRVLVEGCNMVKRHSRPTQDNPQGGIVEKEAPIDVSNVMIEDPKTKEPTRVGYKFVDGKKVRYAKKSGTILDK